MHDSCKNYEEIRDAITRILRENNDLSKSELSVATTLFKKKPAGPLQPVNTNQLPATKNKP